MTRDEILNSIANNKAFYNYCIKKCRYRDIGNDLYQEFFLVLCDKDHEEIVSLYERNYLDHYCYIIINTLNFNRNRFIKVKGNDNPLLEIAGDYSINDQEIEIYNHGIDVAFDKVIRYISTDKTIKQHDVMVLFESMDTTLKDISKTSNCSYHTIRISQSKLKKKIRSHVRIGE